MAANISPILRSHLRRIKLLLCDVDGVLTDGSVFIGGAREIKRFNIRDGLGLVFLRRAGIKVGWVSARPSPVTEARAAELGIDFLVQQGDRTGKTGAVEKLLRRTKLDWDAVCFIGDDVVDLGPLKRAGFAVAVGDARPEVKAAAHHVTGAPGGRGAVREVAEMLLKAQGKWDAIVAHYSK
ncbi:MAG: HAD hydrolase family protein [Verrucomicrobiota bacterium]|jgi:3-deoxy-D-manno-octulosonate 8-phosphate phosphatase (KDO 8-P phosphatase)